MDNVTTADKTVAFETVENGPIIAATPEKLYVCLLCGVMPAASPKIVDMAADKKPVLAFTMLVASAEMLSAEKLYVRLSCGECNTRLCPFFCDYRMAAHKSTEVHSQRCYC